VSLIDDALRRAQAAQAPPPGAPGFRVPMPLPDPGRGRRRRMRRVATGAAAAVAVLAAGFLLLRRGGGDGTPWPVPPRERRDAPAVVAGSPTATAAPSASPAMARGVSPTPAPGRPAGFRTAPAPAASPVPSRSGALQAAPSRTSSAAPRPPLSSPTPGRVLLRQEPPATPIILPPAEIANASASPRLRAAATPGARREPTPRTFAGVANLPSGRLELGGIVYSETGATALINGRVVSVGSFVEGYTVVAIEPTRVELKDDAGTVVLTLH
jgi:hypothetical protein